MGESLLSSPAMYMTEEKLCLKWNDFQENTISSFGKLRDDKEFSDVTLACEDGQQVEAHKLVLASSSPFFMNLLKRNKHPHPLIYMRGMKSEDLVAIKDFLYFGEANVYQGNIDTFLALAEEFNLEGLSKNEQTKDENPNSHQIPTKIIQTHEDVFESKIETKDSSIAESICHQLEQETDIGETERIVAIPNFKVASNREDLDEQIKSMMGLSENRNKGSQHGNARICKVCGKEGFMGNIQTHIESNHITGLSFNCELCGKISRSRNALRMHMSKVCKENRFNLILG